MTTPTKMNKKVQDLLQKYGQNGLKKAKATLNDKKTPKPIQQTLKYFIEETWPNTHHPALIALSCEAVGGIAHNTQNIGAAVVLLTGAADIHDDIIDKSITKGQKQTAYGKFNKDLVLLSGDILLFKGLFLLHKACEKLPLEKQQSIFDSIEKSFFKIGNALTIERCLKGKAVNLKEYQKILETKGAVTEACAEIGAIFGNGTKEEIKTLGHFGRILGNLMTIKNEFSDMRDLEELKNRRDNEILPLPILYAFENISTKRQIMDLLQGEINKQKTWKISEIVMRTTQVKNLKRKMSSLERKEVELLDLIRFNRDEFKLLLQSSLTDL